MITQLNGKLVEKNPTELVVDCNGVGYEVKISLTTFTSLGNEEAVKRIEGQFGEDAYPKRVLMADIPDNALLVPNEINKIPGFKIRHHHFLPGFPEMAWPMVEWILNEYYKTY